MARRSPKLSVAAVVTAVAGALLYTAVEMLGPGAASSPPESGHAAAETRSVPPASKGPILPGPRLDIGRPIKTAKPRSRPGAEARIVDAYRSREGGFMVEVDARVIAVLPDDRDGSRHQRFLIRLEGGHSLLIAHNIDLAERVPVEKGARVRVSGQYEWNERGGVLHWTHRDPEGRREGGFIDHAGSRYW